MTTPLETTPLPKADGVSLAEPNTDVPLTLALPEAANTSDSPFSQATPTASRPPLNLQQQALLRVIERLLKDGGSPTDKQIEQETQLPHHSVQKFAKELRIKGYLTWHFNNGSGPRRYTIPPPPETVDGESEPSADRTAREHLQDAAVRYGRFDPAKAVLIRGAPEAL
ncbi:hypothetical protein [Streptomyces sp. NPDC050428]|uniref:hypothetical protein n=1 Tax=Streptomyces sp. NPDC050428 TaxID=3155757 RepID=UPI003420A675